VLNKQEKFNLTIGLFVHYTDIAIFVMGHFMLTHTVVLTFLKRSLHMLHIAANTEPVQNQYRNIAILYCFIH